MAITCGPASLLDHYGCYTCLVHAGICVSRNDTSCKDPSLGMDEEEIAKYIVANIVEWRKIYDLVKSSH